MAFARNTSRLSIVIVGSSLLVGLAVSAGCEPRHKPAAVAPTATATATTTAPTVATATATAPTATATTAPTATTPPVATATTPTASPTLPTPSVPPIGTWPTMPPGVDPAVLGDIAAKAAAGLGIPVPAPGAPTATAGDPLESMLKANAAKYAAGFTPAGPVGKAKLGQGQHAGMNVNMVQGKCYVVLGVGGAGVTQLGLHVLFPATPPNAVMASDTAHGAQPVIGDGKPLCPPAAASVRIDTEAMQGAGDVAVQVWQK